jgi:hypothetical protein
MSLMSKMRTPRMRIARSPCLRTPPGMQSTRPLLASADMNIRLRYTETSFCDAGQV